MRSARFVLGRVISSELLAVSLIFLPLLSIDRWGGLALFFSCAAQRTGETRNRVYAYYDKRILYSLVSLLREGYHNPPPRSSAW